MNHEPVIDYGRRIGAHFTGANWVKNRRTKVARSVEQFGITLPLGPGLPLFGQKPSERLGLHDAPRHSQSGKRDCFILWAG